MPETNLDSFFNQFAVNPQVFPALIIFCILALPIFGYFYNKLMNRLNHEHEHTSLYVAIGVSVTLGFAALLSWKSALLLLCLFALDGVPMIVGEFKRTNKKVVEAKIPRRKRLPYAASGRIEDAYDGITEASRLLGLALKEKDITVRALQMATASHELHNASTKLLELKVIQQIEE